MTNILNSRNSTNTNPIPARKLTSSKKDGLCITSPPQSLYKYSVSEALKRAEADRLEIKNEAIKTINKNEKKDTTFLKVLSLVTLASILITRKIK